ncbi:MAG: hypothetical protein RLZZ330_150 [Actinomycetota bacterium]|jgi:two-component system OmpR family sensor kinase
MKIRLKLTITYGAVLLFSLTLVGYFALVINHSNNLDTIASKLSSAITAINSYDDSPITASLNVASNSDFPLAAGLLSLDGELTIFSENEIGIKRISFDIAEQASSTPIEIGANTKYLVRAISLGDGSFVILASDLSNLQVSHNDLRNQIAVVILVIMFISLTAALLSLRKEISAIRMLSKEADEVSSGNYEFHFTELKGDSEVASLSRSISFMAKSLQNQNFEMKKLLGDISHELKTPLTSIKGYAELLSRIYSEPSKESQAIEILNSEINHMTRLVDDILLMSKLGAIEYELSDEVDLGQLIFQRFRILQELQPERSVTLVDECGQKVFASEALIIRLIDNLVANAFAHTESSDAIVVTSWIDSGFWTIQYEDAGVGMPDDFQIETETTLFRFDSRASEGRGNGLGLSIIQGIASQHKGSVTIGKSYLGGLLLRVTAPIK